MKIHEIRRVGQNRLEYSYTVEGNWCRYFEMSNPMWAEYSVPVEQIPDSIAVLPLIGNVIVLASLMHADIYVNEIDQDFYECIEEFLQGFDEMTPDHVHFKLRDIVHAEHIVDNPLSDTDHAENLLFFSGGVDATSSLVNHIAEKPTLVTIWGADIPWDNEEQWRRAIVFNQEVADRHDLKLLTIRSNLRKCFNNDAIEDYSMTLVKDWWWPAFHHSLAMMCLAAPLASGKRASLYFGSSYSSKDRKEWGSYVLASAPQIDNHVRFCGCQVKHDGFEFSRHDKIALIGSYYRNAEKKPFLRVCYHANSGANCGTCEKCVRTIVSLLLEDLDPAEFGFPYNKKTLPISFAAGIQEMGRVERYAFLSLYTDLQTKLREKCSVEQVPPILRAFYEVQIETLADFLYAPNNEYLAAIKRSREVQDALYREIGQLRYELQVKEDQVRSLTTAASCSSENTQGHCSIAQNHNETLKCRLIKWIRFLSKKEENPL